MVKLDLPGVGGLLALLGEVHLLCGDQLVDLQLGGGELGRLSGLVGSGSGRCVVEVWAETAGTPNWLARLARPITSSLK